MYEQQKKLHRFCVCDDMGRSDGAFFVNYFIVRSGYILTRILLSFSTQVYWMSLARPAIILRPMW